MFFITDAFAQDAAVQQNPLISFLPIIFIFIAFYFLLLRPQHKKLKMHKEMISAVKKGDKVITSGGIIGTISKVETGEDTVLVEIAPDVKVKVVLSTISEVLNKVPSETKKEVSK